MSAAVGAAVATAQPSAVRTAARQEASTVLGVLGTSGAGLTDAEASARLVRYGPNAVRGHRARPWRVLGRQLRSPILILLFATAIISAFVG